MSRPACVMLVAAEASGDALGAELARALRRRLGADKVRFVGVGGPRMAAEGVESPFDIGELSILGLFEGLLAYPKVVARAGEAAALAAREKPDIAVLIDSWGFTLRVTARLRRRDPALPLVKYVGPQVWASRPGRAKVLARAVDHLLAIHSFDPPYFEKEGLATTFVGNPSLARDFSDADGARFRASIGAAADDPILLMLPGSRPGEIERIMPPFEDAAAALLAARPRLRVVVPLAQSVAEQVKARLARWPHPAILVEGDAAKFDAMKAATVALACSGTVTTELALAGCPMVVGYRVGTITYRLLKALIRTPYITLLNIAAGMPVAPELIQKDCNGQALAETLARRLDDPALRARQIAEQNAALDKMGRGQADPSERAAEVIAGMLAARAGS
jgi:lipid-A-disaccharide synthase